MTKDEVLLFKQFDSDAEQHARICFHTAVSYPNAPKDAPPRQSIECRAFAFFPDHTPNTCPDFDTPDEKTVADRILAELDNPTSSTLLPDSVLQWVTEKAKSGDKKNAGGTAQENVAKVLAQDSDNFLGIKYCSDAYKDRVKDSLMERGIGKSMESLIVREQKGRRMEATFRFLPVVVHGVGLLTVGWILGRMTPFATYA